MHNLPNIQKVLKKITLIKIGAAKSKILIIWDNSNI